MQKPSNGATNIYETGTFRHDMPGELKRLRLLESIFDHTTKKILQDRNPLPNWSCAEVGAGGGSIARWMSGLCPQGHVVATDTDTRFLLPAQGANLSVRSHDLRRDDFEPGTFDLVHCRSVLAHLPNADEILAKMSRWLKPNGWLVVEEPSIAMCADSPYPEFAKLFTMLDSLLAKQGAGLRWSRTLPRTFSRLALANSGMRVTDFTCGQNGQIDEFCRQTFTQVYPVANSMGLITQREFDAGMAMFDDPCFVDTGFSLFSVWGQRINSANLR
ncbi:class I SAM-dependent methyltransferase [Streptomyces olivoreticuli]